ncbi:MAG: NAD-dependent epimerase/dehydratase family protein [Terracidiphilus sp.]
MTGSAGLVGSEAVSFFAHLGFEVVGIENDMRSRFFGEEASTRWNQIRLRETLGNSYRAESFDIRDWDRVDRLFADLGKNISLVIHTAAQPSHDWAAREPHTDFSVNATGTLNILEAARLHCADAPFIFTSTNKVYGDTPNRLPLIEEETRWEIDSSHCYSIGIDESMSIDQTLHSLFGASKVAADVLVQEYGRYFGMKTGVFRGGCLTGPNHSGTKLHGFLAYLMRCAALGQEYTVYGYGGKQVRDNIHCTDLIDCFHQFYLKPRSGEVYNMGGGRFSNASMKEAIALCEEITGQPLKWTYTDENRIGDHIWWISDTGKFKSHYPDWQQKYDVPGILKDIYERNVERWKTELR